MGDVFDLFSRNTAAPTSVMAEPLADGLPPHVRADCEAMRAVGGHVGTWTHKGRPYACLSANGSSRGGEIFRRLAASEGYGRYSAGVIVWGRERK